MMFEFNFDFSGLTRVYEQLIAVLPQGLVVPESVAVPEGDIGKSYSSEKSKVSDPSTSVDDVNVPEVTNQKAQFVYNFYTRDERINPYPNVAELPLSKVPRYIKVSWTSPQVSQFEILKPDLSSNEVREELLIEKNADKLMSEDGFFNPGYVNHTFSGIDAITQGSSDLENFSILSRHNAESVFQMSKLQIVDIASSKDNPDEEYKKKLSELTEAYSKLSDFPQTSLGLRIYDDENNQINDASAIASITDSLKLNLKINSAVITDIFANSREKNSGNFEALSVASSQSKNGYLRQKSPNMLPVQSDPEKTPYLTTPVKLIGYVIERYLVTPDFLRKEETFYVEDISQTSFEDKTVLYGKTYLYTIKVVADVKILLYATDGITVNSTTVYVSSKPTATAVECYEFVPPPEPNDIKFTFDYDKRNLIILWDTPVNSQKDIKQFQVFRRKSIKEPFELIAQYGFDTSETGDDGEGRYKTGERVDANNYYDMFPDDRGLVKVSDKPVYMHTDEEFTVDPEFFVSSEYIYAIASIDAHGMISNYSSQHHVVFDPYKNRLVTKVVCDAGSPRQYPNMKLRTDAFKDVISVEGLAARQLKIFFTPEYLKVRDDRNVTYNIVEAQTPGNASYYLLQLINLDNQKMQLLKINVKDPENLTL